MLLLVLIPSHLVLLAVACLGPSVDFGRMFRGRRGLDVMQPRSRRAHQSMSRLLRRLVVFLFPPFHPGDIGGLISSGLGLFHLQFWLLMELLGAQPSSLRALVRRRRLRQLLRRRLRPPSMQPSCAVLLAISSLPVRASTSRPSPLAPPTCLPFPSAAFKVLSVWLKPPASSPSFLSSP